MEEEYFQPFSKSKLQHASVCLQSVIGGIFSHNLPKSCCHCTVIKIYVFSQFNDVAGGGSNLCCASLASSMSDCAQKLFGWN